MSPCRAYTAAAFIALSPFLLAQNPITSPFPSALDTQNTLLVASLGADTKLASAITAFTTSIPVQDASQFLISNLVTIDSEMMLVCGVTGNTITVCARGAYGTTPNPHNPGARVLNATSPQYHNTVAAAVLAIETFIGVGGGNLGTVTHTSGALTLNQIALGNGAGDIKPLGTLGTSSTVLHGNASGVPAFGAVALGTDTSGLLPSAQGGTGSNNTGNTSGHYLRADGSGHYADNTIQVADVPTLNQNTTGNAATATLAATATVANALSGSPTQCSNDGSHAAVGIAGNGNANCVSITASGGAGQTSQLLDWKFTRVDNTHLNFAAVCLSTATCNVSIGGVTYPFAGGTYTAAYSGSATGSSWFYITTSGTLTACAQTGITITPGAGLAFAGTCASMPSSVILLEQWDLSTGALNATGNALAAYMSLTPPVGAGTGVLSSLIAGTQTISLDPTAVVSAVAPTITGPLTVTGSGDSITFNGGDVLTAPVGSTGTITLPPTTTQLSYFVCQPQAGFTVLGNVTPAFLGYCTIPANTLAGATGAGKSLRVRGFGTITTVGSPPPTVEISGQWCDTLGCGSPVFLFAMNAAAAPDSGLTTNQWQFEWTLKSFVSAGASVNFYSAGTFTLPGFSTIATPPSAAAKVFTSRLPQPLTGATNADRILQIVVIWGAGGTTGSSISLDSFEVLSEN